MRIEFNFFLEKTTVLRNRYALAYNAKILENQLSAQPQSFVFCNDNVCYVISNI